MFKRNVFRKIKIDIMHNKFYLVVIAVFSFLLFAGSVINSSLHTGIDNMEKRLGADIMIVPSGSKENAESMLLEGQRSTFYFNRSVYDNLTKLDGVSDITAQCFLKSLSEDCCTSEVSIVFYDPQKDFIVGPWIQNLNHKTKSQQGNEKETVVVGYNVDVTKENNIKLFGREYTVAGQMAKTGTNLDDSVYFSFEAMKDVSERAEKKGAFLTDIQKKEDIISSVYINIEEGYKITDIVGQAHKLVDGEFDVVFPKDLTESLSKSYVSIVKLINILLITGGILLLIILVMVNTISMNQRKREIAVYRITGNSKKNVLVRILSEIVIAGSVGALLGCAIGILIIIPFGNYIGSLFEMPYLGPDVLGIVIGVIETTVIVSILGAMASLGPIFKICNMQPYLALRKEGE